MPTTDRCLQTPTEITSSEEPDHLLMMQTIFDTVGQPRNYGPTSLEEEERRKAEEKMEREAQEKAEEERQEAENAQHRAAQWEEWVGTGRRTGKELRGSVSMGTVIWRPQDSSTRFVSFHSCF